jgi:hypothetical protein
MLYAFNIIKKKGRKIKMEKKYDLSFLKDIELTEDRKKELEKFFAEYEKILKEKHEKTNFFYSNLKKIC